MCLYGTPSQQAIEYIDNKQERKRTMPTAGKGAKATIKTRFLHPKQAEYAGDKQHQSDVVLVAKEERRVNKKLKMCYVCRKEGSSDLLFACKTHFKIVKEGASEDFFEGEKAALKYGPSRSSSVGYFLK